MTLGGETMDQLWQADKYKELEPLTAEPDSPILVRNNQSGEFWVQKKYPRELEANLRTLMTIRNPHIAKIEEIHVIEETIYVYEEYVHGKNLNTLLQSSDGLSTKFIYEMSLQLLDGLISLHKSGLIHRDIKPSNIMISNDDRIKLIDFDAIRQFNGKKENDTTLLGTVGFASPEQFGFAETDSRSDLYSLGVVMNVCAVKEYPQTKLPNNYALKAIILHATKMDPADRYQTAEEMKRAIKINLASYQSVVQAQANRPYEKAQTKSQPTEQTYQASPAGKKQNASKRLYQKTQVEKKVTKSILFTYFDDFRSMSLPKKAVIIFGYVLIAMGAIGGVKERFTPNETFFWYLGVFILIFAPYFFFTSLKTIRLYTPLLQSNRKRDHVLAYSLFFLAWFIAWFIYVAISPNLS
ncbi:hypothetical protein RV11_GL000011 [Enterococcus phoeniculicola]|nr:hypothetical protein RV11_GL000011 [Enterococcus phoeniculicola]